MPAAPLVTTPLTLEILQQFRVIYGSMRQHFREVENHCGITGSQAWALQEVERNPDISIGQLARRMGIRPSTSSLLVDKLAGLGLLEKRRCAADQRRIGLHIAARGRKALQALPGPAEGLLPEALSKLPEVVLKTLSINLFELTRRLPDRGVNFADTPLADLLRSSSGHEK